MDKQLVGLKDTDWIKAVPSQSLQDVIERLDKAYQSFFKGGGYPKWAKRGKYNSITFKSVKTSASKGSFVLPKLEKVKTFYSQAIPKEAVLKRATIMKETDGFYISVMVGEAVSPLPCKNQAVGLDWGIAHFLTLSTGEQIENPKF